MNHFKAFLSAGVFAAALLSFSFVLAEETSTTEGQMQAQIVSTETEAEQLAAQAVSEDEAINLETDLETGDPSLLPDSPFYFIKNWTRGIQSFFTFDKAKKAELKLKFSSEKMAEAQKLFEKNKMEKAVEAVRSSNADMERAKEVLGQMENNSQADKILEKMAQKTISHQKFFDVLQSRFLLPNQNTFTELKEAMISSYLSSEKAEKIQERLQKALEKQTGSDFKEIKNMELLEEIKDIAPEKLKEKIENAKDNEAEKLAKKMESLSEEKLEILQPYLERFESNKGLVVSLLSRFKNQEISTTTLQKLEKIEEKIIQQIESGKDAEEIKALLEEAEEKLAGWENKISEDQKLFTDAEYQKLLDSISLVRKELEKADQVLPEGKAGEAFGQITAAEAKIKTLVRNFTRYQQKQNTPTTTEEQSSSDEQVACPALWDPVCAEDGKTYSNECVAEQIKKLKIQYKGECKKTEEETPTSSNSSGNTAGIANPASVYCEKLGFTLEIRTDAEGGQYGVCIFNDGNECEEWKFFRGECGSEYKKGTGAGSESNGSLNSSSLPASSASGQ